MSFDFRRRSLTDRKKKEFRDHNWEAMEEEFWEDYEEDYYGEEADEEYYEEESEFPEEEYYEEAVEGYYEEFGEESYEEAAEEENDDYYEENNSEEYYEEAYEEQHCSEEEYIEEEYSEDDSLQLDDELYAEADEKYYEEDYEEYMGEDAEEYYQRDGYTEEEYLEEESEEKPQPLAKWMDYMIIFAAVAMLLIAIILGGSFLFKDRGDSNEQIQQVGNQLSDIEVIGEEGLLAMSDAKKALQAMAQLPENTEPPQEESEEPGYEEEDYHIDVTVKLSLTSIEKDLKIKFLNQETGKLVGNVPFGIEITDADGKHPFGQMMIWMESFIKRI